MRLSDMTRQTRFAIGMLAQTVDKAKNAGKKDKDKTDGTLSGVSTRGLKTSGFTLDKSTVKITDAASFVQAMAEQSGKQTATRTSPLNSSAAEETYSLKSLRDSLRARLDAAQGEAEAEQSLARDRFTAAYNSAMEQLKSRFQSRQEETEAILQARSGTQTAENNAAEAVAPDGGSPGESTGEGAGAAAPDAEPEDRMAKMRAQVQSRLDEAAARLSTETTTASALRRGRLAAYASQNEPQPAAEENKTVEA